jgi:hypothetical protein
MAGKIKTWVWVVAAIFILGILGIVAMAGLSIYFFSQHIETRNASPAIAERDFEQVKSQFQGQKPLIELDRNGRYLRSNTEIKAKPGASTPENVHVIAFDPDDARVVKVTIPFWLLRLKMQGATIDLNGRAMDLEDLRLTVEDLERFGPILIVDYRSPDGERVLVWSQ